jgi:hypothetical protein
MVHACRGSPDEDLSEFRDPTPCACDGIMSGGALLALPPIHQKTNGQYGTDFDARAVDDLLP